MRKYSVEQYKEFLDAFTSEPEYKNYRQKIYKKEFWNKDLFILDDTEMKFFLVDEVLVRSKSLKYLQDIRHALSQFFQWSVDKGIIAHNILEEEECTYEVFMEYMLSKMDITVYYKEDIEKIEESMKINIPLFKMLIRLHYEGIERTVDILNIKLSDINFDEKSIKYGDNKIKISDDLATSIQEYMKITSFEYYDRWGNLLERKLYQFENHLIKSPDSSCDEVSYNQNMKKTINYYFKTISNMYKLNVSQKDLFASGFVNYVKMKCDESGKNNLYLVNVFRICSKVRFQNKITNFAKEYGIPGNLYSSHLRQKFYPYVLKSRYYDS
ncbi:hypothetical protein [uncultured Robinsoniella sp.]|uniref:hypothetical protein n=1 Tax=uncultured Robinsoniella sp. TaxID=904190 RepID=UPI00374F8CD6